MPVLKCTSYYAAPELEAASSQRLHLPTFLVASEGGHPSNLMANRDAREALRGAEEEVVDLLAEALSPEQWARLLTIPLERAAAKGSRGVAQKLVKARAEIGDALHGAAGAGHAEVAGDLLEAGASIAATDSGGRTPLHNAARGGKTEMVRLFLLKGACIDVLDDSLCASPLFLAAEGGHEAAALVLMAAGADVDLRCLVMRWSVAHMAAKLGLMEVLRVLIENGADVNATDTAGLSPLHVAAMLNQLPAINVLVEAGANVNARSLGGYSPLHEAACNLYREALLALLKHGAEVNAQEGRGQTPLHYAAREGGTQGAAVVVDSLLRSGADETIANTDDELPSDVVGVPEVVPLDAEPILVEEFERVRGLLANAPANRAWRRRGYLVLSRAHPSRVQLPQESNSASASVARRTRGGVELARVATRSEGGAAVDARSSSGWVGVVARALGVQEEGIFRTIVGYL